MVNLPDSSVVIASAFLSHILARKGMKSGDVWKSTVTPFAGRPSGRRTVPLSGRPVRTLKSIFSAGLLAATVISVALVPIGLWSDMSMPMLQTPIGCGSELFDPPPFIAPRCSACTFPAADEIS